MRPLHIFLCVLIGSAAPMFAPVPLMLGAPPLDGMSEEELAAHASDVITALFVGIAVGMLVLCVGIPILLRAMQMEEEAERAEERTRAWRRLSEQMGQ